MCKINNKKNLAENTSWSPKQKAGISAIVLLTATIAIASFALLAHYGVLGTVAKQVMNEKILPFFSQKLVTWFQQLGPQMSHFFLSHVAVWTIPVVVVTTAGLFIPTVYGANRYAHRRREKTAKMIQLK